MSDTTTDVIYVGVPGPVSTEPGPPGEGVPEGGDTGQVLAKATGTDFDTEWVDQSGGGAVDSVNTQTGDVVLDASDVGADPAGTAASLVASEATDRTAADDALDGRVTALEAVDPLTETEADSIYRRQDTALVDGDIPAAIARDTEVASAVSAHTAASDPHADRAYTDGQITALKNGAPAGGDTLAELDARIAVVEALGSLATDAELVAAVAALIGSADTAGDTLGELQALIGLRLLKSANLSDLANVSTALTNLGFSAFAKTLIDDADAGTARATLGLRDGDDGTNTTVNTATANKIKWDLVSDPTALNSIGYTNAKVTTVRLAATAALPSCTYDNGSSGVGATLTATANGALTVDGVAVATGDRLLIPLQSSLFQNGLYTVTNPGGAGAQFVLTRLTLADIPSEWSNPLVVIVGEGTVYAGKMLVSKPGSGATMGTTAIRFNGLARPFATPGDVMFGPDRGHRMLGTDFEELVTAITASLTKIPGTGTLVCLGGTSATATQDEATDNVPGVIKLQTGTTSTGFCNVSLSSFPATFSANRLSAFAARAKVATVSDAAGGTNAFNVYMGTGEIVTTAAAMTYGLFFRQVANGNLFCVSRHSGSETTADTGTTITTAYKDFVIVYDEIAGKAFFYIDGVEVSGGGISANLPSADGCMSACHILKTNGGTSRSLSVDRLIWVGRDSRSLSPISP